MINRLGGGLGAVALAGTVRGSEPPHFRPRARRVIQLFMNGGPYQADLFDPKPLLAKYAGRLGLACRRLRGLRRRHGGVAGPAGYHGGGRVVVSNVGGR